MATVQKISPCLWFDRQAEEALFAMLGDRDGEKADRTMKAVLQMKKLDLAALQAAYRG